MSYDEPERQGHDAPEHDPHLRHPHGHQQHERHDHRGRLLAVLAITVAVLVVELVVGLAIGSLVLVGDAGHLAVDATAIALAWAAVTLARRPPTDRRSFGLARLEVLGTSAATTALGVVAVLVAIRAVERLADPEPTDPRQVIWVGVLGLVANAVALRLLPHSHGHGHTPGLAVRSARLEVLADLLGSAAVVVAGTVELTTGSHRADPVAALFVVALVMPRVVSLLREATDILLQAAPRGLDLDAVREHLLGADGVLEVHDVHAWSVTSGQSSFSAHVVVADEVLSSGRSPQVLDHLTGCLADHFGIEHATLQLEPPGHSEHEGHVHA